ncbi:MAG: hypothetical protein A2268_11955 [Candidatus Raymondbacteria bacterium RifOxyA12_full_50_37]|uniref:BrnT family toxin n=1 Tax=Candidatus Raymondbacteria bacterium RIFOXYD12_FULL_49_13 TaxID=1817890 RepID=A0A1F7FGS8_UNCRA|nr:MAG: hypothetical protein A2268_11955 [Candidatus Raymondbacteria bacterium RifOxyA12_full_50_37]OGJ91694.1 MAG: hypothetical protein A2248_08020 [Candidatus Raymondbacteria bacterium RIFOXYA2_FULL_49_16]OGJ98705.1 MAG: hypothetical protein A2453_08185 [Candidatus Raymondbacteria bacterium RIFOXYC2_FULL_50_21]OGK01521.1 MAG: hypothetical protein A2487_13390 [Candidatus Raymondbacteria bacterium RifOxyC12_full_50_8]OGK02195.1 MAG: hypothetical protein A2350_20245 [Candidatus Raymondbacteria b
MNKIEFIWDEKKAELNYKKHGVTFNEAVTVFYDEFATEYFDEEHSDDEDRYLLLGISSQLRTLIVCYCSRENNKVIRIISARKATKNESKYYRRFPNER